MNITDERLIVKTNLTAMMADRGFDLERTLGFIQAKCSQGRCKACPKCSEYSFYPRDESSYLSFGVDIENLNPLKAGGIYIHKDAVRDTDSPSGWRGRLAVVEFIEIDSPKVGKNHFQASIFRFKQYAELGIDYVILIFNASLNAAREADIQLTTTSFEKQIFLYSDFFRNIPRCPFNPTVKKNHRRGKSKPSAVPFTQGFWYRHS